MDDFEHSMTRIASCIKAGARQVLPGGPLWIGEVKEAGGGRLRVACGGMQLEREDLWVAAGLDFVWTVDTGGAELLRRGDRVVLLSPDGQDYYLTAKVVRA